MANRTQCFEQLRSIALAWKACANDDATNHYFPWAGGAAKNSDVDVFAPLLMTATPPGTYVTDTRIFHCPSSQKTTTAKTYAELVAGGHCDYSCVAGKTAADRLKDDGDTDTPILADNQATPGTSPHKGGYNIYFMDGHGQWAMGTHRIWMVNGSMRVVDWPKQWDSRSATFQFEGPGKIWLNPK